jgi:hypothetical protein
MNGKWAGLVARIKSRNAHRVLGGDNIRKHCLETVNIMNKQYLKKNIWETEEGLWE